LFRRILVMSKIVFDSPDGSDVENPRFDDLVNLIWTKGEAYWNSLANTGFGTLSYHRGDEEVARLVLSKRDGYGFHMLFTEYPFRTKESREFIAVGGDDYQDVTDIHLSG